MTLVASILGKGLPVLLGDLLISREGEVADSVISVPSVGEISASAFGYTAVQLRQKLCIINDGLAVGWAGSRIAATTVIRDLLSAAKGQEFSKTDLENFFKNLDRRDLRDLKIVGLIRVDDHTESFSLPGLNLTQSPYGKFQVIGSGSTNFLEMLGNLESPDYSDGFNSRLPTIGIAYGMISATWAKEFSTLDGLLKAFYGGGFELITLERGRFKKVDGVTYLFWVAEQKDDGYSISMPIAAINTSYRADLLLIRTLRFTGSELPFPSVHAPRHEIHVAGPIYRALTNNDVRIVGLKPLPTFNTEVVCHIFHVVESSGRSIMHFRMDYGDSVRNSIKFTENDLGGVQGLELHGTFLHSIAKTIVSAGAEKSPNS